MADLLILEAPTRFELVMEILQTSALPLGDGAIKKEISLNTKGHETCQATFLFQQVHFSFWRFNGIGVDYSKPTPQKANQ